jgi:Cu+-exporting ATPase
MATDPVCGMDIEEDEAEARSEYKGTTFYFCSQSCKEQFDSDPEAFADNVPSPPYYA